MKTKHTHKNNKPSKPRDVKDIDSFHADKERKSYIQIKTAAMKENIMHTQSDLIMEADRFSMDELEDETEAARGYILHQKEIPSFEISISQVDIINDIGAKKFMKPMGTYITIESPYLRDYDLDAHKKVMHLLMDTFKDLYTIQKNETVLIVGLGNIHITPDSLGPKTADKILVTRQINKDEVKLIKHQVAAITPGVLGLTGIETTETIQGIVEKIKPNLVIAIDALVAKSASRLNSTIQISNTGISPGGGIDHGKKRVPLNKDNLGVPVIAIGIPTVVDASSVVYDTILSLQADKLLYIEPEDDMLTGNLSDEIVIHLAPHMGNMLVTPNDVDGVIERLSVLISNAINVWIHPDLNGTEFLPLTQ